MSSATCALMPPLLRERNGPILRLTRHQRPTENARDGGSWHKVWGRMERAFHAPFFKVVRSRFDGCSRPRHVAVPPGRLATFEAGFPRHDLGIGHQQPLSAQTGNLVALKVVQNILKRGIEV